MQEPSQFFRLLVAVLLSIFLMVVDCQVPQFKRVRAQLSWAVYPVQLMIDAPLSLTSNLTQNFHSYKYLIDENEEMRLQLLRQQGELQKLTAVEAENKRLRALLNSAAETRDMHSVATILRVDSDPFTHQVIINKGLLNDVVEGQPVIDANGVMGGIISVDAKSSRVMLITDASYGIPVENTRNGIRAVATGTGSLDRLELQHVPHTVDILEGDTFVTSGLGGRFPYGYPVGVVSNVNKDLGKPFAVISLKPKAKLERSRQVLLVKPIQDEELEQINS